MPRDVVALVSADDLVSAVRVYADRVNDLLRRGGITALEAIEVAETHAQALLDAVVTEPETVIDLAGWWFARSIEFVTHGGVATQNETPEQPTSMLAGTLGEAEVRAALESLPESERSAVMLRDGYDLPEPAVGVALHRGLESAAGLTTAARLHLVAAYDQRPVPTLSGHTGRMTVDLVTLSRLADGTLESPRAVALRRHAASCPACEDAIEMLAKGRRLAAGLPILAMDDDAREALIRRVSARADASLPSHDEVLRAVDEDTDPGPVISPVLVIAAMVLAVLIGVGIAKLNHSANTPTVPPPAPSVTIEPPGATPAATTPLTTPDAVPTDSTTASNRPSHPAKP